MLQNPFSGIALHAYIHTVIHTGQESNSEDDASLDYKNSPLQHSFSLGMLQHDVNLSIITYRYLFRSLILRMTPSLDQSPFADSFLQYRATLVYNIH